MAVTTILDFFASLYNAANLIHLGHLILMLAMLVSVYIPLFLLGNILGRNLLKVEPPAKSSLLKQAVLKQKSWYSQPILLLATSGGLTFLAIYTETYYIFQSFYNYKFYYVYSFGLAVYVMLLICSACVSVVSTYIFLNSEDFRWPWLSFMSSASCALFVFGYAVYFYTHTRMHGFY